MQLHCSLSLACLFLLTVGGHLCGLCPSAAAGLGGYRIKSHKGVHEPVLSNLYGNSRNSINFRPDRKVYIHVLKLSPLYRTLHA